MSPWLFLALSICLEVTGTTLLKYSNGFQNILCGMLSIASYSICFWILAFAFKSIPVGVAYAIWSGVGTVLIVLIGIVLFNESIDIYKALFMTMIVVGAVGLHLVSNRALS